jgi:hypothetical protein
MMYADELFAHDGKFVMADEPGDILVEYAGSSQAREGAYDNLLAGRLPVDIPCSLSMRSVSANPRRRPFNRRVYAVGTFEGLVGTLDSPFSRTSDCPSQISLAVEERGGTRARRRPPTT